MMVPDVDVAGSSDDVADAFQAITATTSFINSADSKAGLGAAAVAAFMAVLSQQSASLSSAFSLATPTDQLAFVDLVLLGLSLAATTCAIGHALLPRRPVRKGGGRFSYPDIAKDDWTFSPASRAKAASEAWAQAQTLARIAEIKFAGVRISIQCLGGCFLFFVCWIVLATRI
jgi:hypothetical protein